MNRGYTKNKKSLLVTDSETSRDFRRIIMCNCTVYLQREKSIGVSGYFSKNFGEIL